MCSITTGQCPSSSISGYQFNSHYDCTNAGYAMAQKTFRNLKELPEWDIPDFETSSIHSLNSIVSRGSVIAEYFRDSIMGLRKSRIEGTSFASVFLTINFII